MASTKLLECGRVLVGGDCSLYALDCLHCKAVYTQWEIFLGHIKGCKKFMRKQRQIHAAREEMDTEAACAADEDAETEEWPADDKEVETEQLLPAAVADNLKHQIEQLCVKNANKNGVGSRRAKEIVAAWPIELPSHEDAENCANDSDDYDNESEDGSVAESGDDDDVVVAGDNDELDVVDELSDDDSVSNGEDDGVSNGDDDDGVSNDDDISDDNVGMNINDFVEDQSSNQQEIDVDDMERDELLQTAKEKLYETKIHTYADVPTATATLPAEKQTLSLSFVLTPANVIKELIAHVKAHPCLWKGKTTAYRNQKARNDALQYISDALNITNDSAAKSVRYLLRWYTFQHHKRSVSSAADSDNADPHMHYYKMCDFLSERMAEVDASCDKLKLKSKDKQAICPYCGKCLANRTIFGHIKRHTKSLSFKCEVCSKLMRSASELQTHMRVHTGEKPYVCSTCGKKYKTSSALCGHKHRHEKPTFQCTQCPKAYHKNYLLKNHMNVHLNRRPFQCKFCLKSFTSKRYLYMHMKPVLRCAKGKATPTE